jgi:hypothetical protein
VGDSSSINTEANNMDLLKAAGAMLPLLLLL